MKIRSNESILLKPMRRSGGNDAWFLAGTRRHDVVVLESMRIFSGILRGDTIHPSTLVLMHVLTG